MRPPAPSPGAWPRAPRLYLGQPVPQRLDHDAAVVVALLLVGLAQLLHPKAGNGKQAQVVGDAWVQGGDEVREAEVRVRAGRVLLGLETQGVGGAAISTDVALTPSKQQSSVFQWTQASNGLSVVFTPVFRRVHDI